MAAGEVYYRLANRETIYHLSGQWEVSRPLEQPFYVFQAYQKDMSFFLRGERKVVSELPAVRKISIGQIPAEKDEAYINSVEEAVSVIADKDNALEKVVLGRSLSIPASEWDGLSAFQLICKSYPAAYVSLVRLNNSEWLFASPELLLKWNGALIESISLAGTISKDEKEGFTAKEVHEQALVSEYITDIFTKNHLRAIETEGPEVLEAGHLKHLCTYLKGKSQMDPLSLAYKLHPTPAVCGLPPLMASDFIARNERTERSFFTGFQGYVKDNEGELFVNLRCVEVREGLLRFYAGAGITADSDAEKEHEECREKMNTLIQLFDQ